MFLKAGRILRSKDALLREIKEQNARIISVQRKLPRDVMDRTPAKVLALVPRLGAVVRDASPFSQNTRGEASKSKGY